MYTAVYGSGIEADSKDNFQIGWLAKQRVSYRFRASSTDLLALAVNLRGGPNPYSGGDGGIVRLTVHPDDGHGKPNETVTLGSMSFHPGNPAGNWEHFDFWAFISTVKLVKGELYHVVFANTASAQTTNWVSLNATTTLSGKRSPRQPAFTDDFALLYNKGSGWKGPGDAPGANNADPAEKTPVIDLVYADGTHDGNGYYQATVSEYAVIGGQNRVRQTFTPKKAFSATRASFRVKRHQGIGPVTMDIYRGSTKIASAVVAGSGIPATDYPVPVGDNHWDGNSLAGGRWLDMVFPQIDFQANVAYSYELSAPTGTIYIAIPIREIGATEHATWGARLFRDGQAEQSSNGGSSWVAAYPAPHDWQFYFADLAA